MVAAELATSRLPSATLRRTRLPHRHQQYSQSRQKTSLQGSPFASDGFLLEELL